MDGQLNGLIWRLSWRYWLVGGYYK